MVQKTGCEEHGDEEPFTNGLEDRHEKQSCKRTGRQERRSKLRMDWKTGCNEPFTKVRKTGCDEPIVSGLLIEVPGEAGAEGGRVERVAGHGVV